MSEASSHSSHRSQGSLGPEDSVSRVLPQYFTDSFCLSNLGERAVKFGQGTGAGSGCSELGSDMSAQLGSSCSMRRFDISYLSMMLIALE